MILPDVNVLLYAHRADAPRHAKYVSWLEGVVNGPAPFGLSTTILSGFLRVATHPRIFDPPTPLEDALEFLNELKSAHNCVIVSPGRRHWSIFEQLCRSVGARGNLVADAFIAAIALEAGCELVTTDADFAQFPGLKWRHPLADA